MRLLQSLRSWLHRGTSRWLHGDPSPGAAGERRAASMLKQRGYRIRQLNYRCSLGEIDIVAMDPANRTLVIVEVKTAEARDARTAPEFRVGEAKQRKLAALAGHYARRFAMTDRVIRFDVVAVDLSDAEESGVKHYEHAFESPY